MLSIGSEITFNPGSLIECSIIMWDGLCLANTLKEVLQCFVYRTAGGEESPGDV